MNPAKRKKSVAPFRVGDRVTTEFGCYDDDDCKRAVRTVTKVLRCSECSSGWLVSASQGDPCTTCSRPYGEEIELIDSAWFERVIA